MLDIPRIREDFPALQHGIYLHTAGIGMNARPVLAEVTDRWQFFFENGPWLQSRRDERFLHKQRTREALARLFQRACRYDLNGEQRLQQHQYGGFRPAACTG